MPVVINGTTGINTPGVVNTAAETIATTLAVTGVTTVQAGTAALPAITTTGDTNTGIFFPAADTIAFTEGGAEAMRIDSSGNVGIGTSSPADRLDIRFASGTGNFKVGVNGGNNIKLYNTAGDIFLLSSDASSDVTLDSQRNILFRTATTERMRLDSSGNLFVGKTASSTGTVGHESLANGSGGSTFTLASPNQCFIYNNTSTAGTAIIDFRVANTSKGSIQFTNTATAYLTASDYRLKEAIIPMQGALAKVVALKPCTYKWKIDGSDGQGFIAHELSEVCPDAVTGEKDGEQMQGVDYGRLTPILTAALQEAIAKIETLEARIAVLEAK